MYWRNHSIVGPGQGFGHVKAVAAHGPDELRHGSQRPKFMRRKWLACSKLARWVDDGAGWMIDYHQFGLVEIKHLPKLLGNSELISAIFRRKRPIIPQGEKLLRVRLDIAPVGQRETQWSGAKDISHKPELLAVPGIKIGAGARGDSQFHHGKRLQLHR